MLARRSFMQMLGITPVAAMNGKASLAKLVNDPLYGIAANAAGSTLPAGMPQPQSLIAKTFGAVVGREFDRARNRFDQELSYRSKLQAGGIDPDIDCLKSVSRNYKARKQLERDMENSSLFWKYQEMAWGG